MLWLPAQVSPVHMALLDIDLWSWKGATTLLLVRKIP